MAKSVSILSSASTPSLEFNFSLPNQHLKTNHRDLRPIRKHCFLSEKGHFDHLHFDDPRGAGISVGVGRQEPFAASAKGCPAHL